MECNTSDSTHSGRVANQPLYSTTPSAAKQTVSKLGAVVLWLFEWNNRCWWKKSCTSWYGKYRIIYRVSYMSGVAGFLPSTVWCQCSEMLDAFPATPHIFPTLSIDARSAITTQANVCHGSLAANLYINMIHAYIYLRYNFAWNEWHTQKWHQFLLF